MGEGDAAQGGDAGHAQMSEEKRRAEFERALAAAERASTAGSAMLPSVVSWSPPRGATGPPRTAAAEDDEVAAVEGIAPPAPPSGEAMPEPMTMVLDLDFETWDDVVEEMWKKKVCVVARMLEADDLEVVRVSAGSVVIEAMIHSPLWRDALTVLHADLAKGKEGLLWASVKALSLSSPLSSSPVEQEGAASPDPLLSRDASPTSHTPAPAPLPLSLKLSSLRETEAEAGAEGAATKDATSASAGGVGAGADDGGVGAGADEGGEVSERLPTASAREEIERQVTAILEQGTFDAEAMALSSVSSSQVGSAQSSARGGEGQASHLDADAGDPGLSSRAPRSRPSSARPGSAARTRTDVIGSYQRPGSAQSGAAEARRSRPGSASVRPASAKSRPGSAVAKERSPPPAAAAPGEFPGDLAAAAPVETASGEAVTAASTAGAEAAASEAGAGEEKGVADASAASAMPPNADDASASAAEPPAQSAPARKAGAETRLSEALDMQAAGMAAAVPAPGLAYEEAVKERDRARAEAKDGGKAGALAPRDDAAAMEAAMLAAHTEEQEELPAHTLGENMPHADEPPQAKPAAAAAAGVQHDMTDWSNMDSSHISSAEMTQMAQTVGADFFGSALLDTDVEADADAHLREGAAGIGKAGVSFDEASRTTDGARADPGTIKGKDMSMTTVSLGATASTALSMADTKARPGDTQAMLGLSQPLGQTWQTTVGGGQGATSMEMTAAADVSEVGDTLERTVGDREEVGEEKQETAHILKSQCPSISPIKSLATDFFQNLCR